MVCAGARTAVLLEGATGPHHWLHAAYTSVGPNEKSNIAAVRLAGNTFIVNTRRMSSRLAAVTSAAAPWRHIATWPEVAAVHKSNEACRGLVLSGSLRAAYEQALSSALQLLRQAIERDGSYARESGSAASLDSHAAAVEDEWASVPKRRGARSFDTKHASSAATTCAVADVDASALRRAAAEAFAAALCPTSTTTPASSPASAATSAALSATPSPLCMSAVAGWLLEYPVLYDTRLRLPSVSMPTPVAAATDVGREACAVAGGSAGALAGASAAIASAPAAVSASADGGWDGDWRSLLADSDDTRSCLDGQPLLLCSAIYTLRTAAGADAETAVRFSLPLLRMTPADAVSADAASSTPSSPSDAPDLTESGSGSKPFDGEDLTRLPAHIAGLLERWQVTCRDTVAALRCPGAAGDVPSAAAAAGGGSASSASSLASPACSVSPAAPGSPVQSVRFEYAVVRRERIVL